MLNVAELIRLDLDCGICSNIWTTINMSYKVFNGGFIPVVNFRDLPYRQFHDDSTVGKVNVWEDYFKQPFSMTLDDIDGIVHEKNTYYSEFPLDSADEFDKRYFGRIVLNTSEYVSEMVETELSNIDFGKTLGVLIRGTDYRSIRPAGHPVQPELSVVINDILATRDEFGITDIFVVSDEKRFADEIYCKTGLNVVQIQSRFINNNRPVLNSEIMKSIPYEEKREMNREYLSSVIILSKLKYVILSNTSALNTYDYFRINGKRAVYEKRYNLGNY